MSVFYYIEVQVKKMMSREFGLAANGKGEGNCSKAVMNSTLYCLISLVEYRLPGSSDTGPKVGKGSELCTYILKRSLDFVKKL